MNISLTFHELAIAANGGVQRQLKALDKKFVDRHGFNSDPWTCHIMGCAAEMAVAKSMGIYWTPTMNSFKGADIGSNIQVRWRSKEFYDLPLRPDDNGSHSYVLVTGGPKDWCVHGWMLGDIAKERAEWWQTYGDRPPAWFVPQAALYPMAELEAR